MEDGYRRRPERDMFGAAVKRVLSLAVGKAAAYIRSLRLWCGARTMRVSPPTAARIADAVRERLRAGRERQTRTGEQAQTPGGTRHSRPCERAEATDADEALVRSIAAEAAACNRNNVTRTAAYLRVYGRSPELHWALLAHLVSRNGGWNMTDLRGDLLPHLLPERMPEAVFSFLERANALIFHDAYPQLRLYQESVKRGRNLFNVLPLFGVSVFMRAVWDEFWSYRDPAPLTIGLIVNEQHYIERRVIANEMYRRRVLDTLPFRAQPLLQLNQVLLPYYSGDPMPLSPIPSASDGARGTASARGAPGSTSAGGARGNTSDGGAAGHAVEPPRLAGLVVEQFADLNERIGVGKKLYAMLFGVPSIREGSLRFAGTTPHTGSRADYWPQLYAAERAEPYCLRHLRHGKSPSAPLFSPALGQAWPDLPFEPPEPGDWCEDLSALAYLQSVQPPLAIDMTNEHRVGIGKQQLAASAARVWGHRHSPE